MRSIAVAATFAAVLAMAPRAHAIGELQAPELARPERSSVAGEYSHVVFGPADLDRGGLSLRAPIDLPTARGTAAGDWLPVYSGGGGLGEWGMGWRSALAITRFRVAGDLDYLSDELTGPWGRMSRGQDGFWYPRGLTTLVRVKQLDGSLIAYLPDGSVWTFGSTVKTVQGIYSWSLTSVETATGRKTSFQYDTNPSGRLFLHTVTYGGVGDDAQYSIELQYEPVPLLFVDYSSGQELTLDRRVKTVIVSAKSAATGSFVERWRYTLQYQTDAFGPAFYLVEIDQTFGSGQSAPPVRYTYRTAADHLASATFTHVAELDPVLQQLGADLLQSTRSTVLDLDNDGRPDLEESSAGTLVRRTDSGFSVEPLAPPPSAGAWAGCRPAPSWMNPPRHLAELRAYDGDTEVLDLEPTVMSTDAYVCARDGTLLAHEQLDGDWSLGETTRLVDLDRDFQPDLVRVGFGFYEVRPNQSSPAGFAFGAPITGTLSPAFTPTSAWVQDFNGDGLPDLVARDSSTFTVWFGEGQFRFASQGQTFDLRDASGTSVSNLDDYSYTFVDANRDGLIDLLLVQNNVFYLFVNNGYYLQQQQIPALASLAYDANSPLFADLTGAGNDALTVVTGGQAFSLALDEPGTGLMASADDGRGTVLLFDWQRAPAAANTFQRHVLVAQLTVQTTGDDAMTYRYAYAGPRVHSVGRFMLGFAQVTRSAPTSSDTETFNEDDDVTGLPLTSTHLDQLTPDALRFEARQYDEASFQGLRWLRPASLRRGDERPDGSVTLEQRTDWLTWNADFCPAETRTTDARGTLTVDVGRANPSALVMSLHCLEASEVQTGVHADHRLDFRHEDHVERNDVGLITHAYKLGALGALTTQQATYNADWTLATITSPATGISTFAWDPTTHLLRQVVDFDGSSATVASRDPVSDGITEIDSAHGSLRYAEYFRYDGQERLQKRWDNLGQASDANPDKLLSYRYATATQPAAVIVQELVDASQGSVARSVDLDTGAGDAIAHARLLPKGWSFDALTTRSSTRAETDRLVRPTLTQGDPSALDLTALLSGAQSIATTHRSTLAVDADTLTRFSAAVQRTTQTRVSVSTTARAEIEVENGSLTRTRSRDVDGRLVGYDDPEGSHWGYGYDTLGRLRVVWLPDGTTARRDVDDYGRDSIVSRDGIGRIEYGYDATTGLLRSTRWSGSDGTPMRVASFGYDGAGRKTSEEDQDLVGGAVARFSFYYDGATPASPDAHGTPGLLTAVSGDGFVKTFDYRPDGRIAHRRVELTGWRTVDTTWSFAESGNVRGHTTVLGDAAGSVLSTTTVQDRYDAFGRVAAIELNGAPLASLAYDDNGLLATASFAGGSATFGYEPLTRAPSGFDQRTAAWTSENHWTRNARGLLDSELVSVGNANVTRSYAWSPRGQLAGSTDALASWQYEYAATGLPSRIVDGSGDRQLVRNGDTLTDGSDSFRFDALGRTVQHGELILGYGANGQIATATRGAATWSYKYDEAGQRILKLSGATPIAAYLPEGYLDGSGLTEPLRLADHTVGVVQEGRFREVPTDHRGTLLGEDDGTARLSSPFGDRATHPATAAAIDFVEKGWDADLGVVRMGVRDYDPHIGRFLEPDPLFLAHPDLCARSPVECNLYGYAGGDPLDHIDSTGTVEEWVHDTLDVLAFVPLVGSFADLSHAAAYASEGRWKAAVVSAVVAIPFIHEGSELVRGARAVVKGEHILAVAVEHYAARGAVEVTEKTALEQEERSDAHAAAGSMRPATQQPSGGSGVVLKDGQGATAEEMRASVGGVSGGSRKGQQDVRKQLIEENGSGKYTCWRCGQTSENAGDMHLGHRNVPTSKGGNLSPQNVCLEGAACNLSAGNRGAPSPGMSCAERGSCGAPYGR